MAGVAVPILLFVVSRMLLFAIAFAAATAGGAQAALPADPLYGELGVSGGESAFGLGGDQRLAGAS